MEFEATMRGQFRWIHLLDIPNTNKPNPIKRIVQVKTKATFSYESMIRSLDCPPIVRSMGINTSGILGVTCIQVNGELVSEIKEDYENICRSRQARLTVFHMSGKVPIEVDVEANSILRIYRLVFEGPGVTYLTQTLSNNLRRVPDIPIKIKGRLLPVLKDIEVLHTNGPFLNNPIDHDHIKEAMGFSADVNRNYGEQHVWLKAIWTIDASQGVSGIEVVVPQEKIEGNGDYKDLTNGANGDFRYLRMLRDPEVTHRITEISLWRRLRDNSRLKFIKKVLK